MKWKRFGNDGVLMVVLSKFSEVTEENQKHLGIANGPGRLVQASSVGMTVVR